MSEIESTRIPRKVFSSSWAAFYLYYVAIFICWVGPQLNPTFADRIFLSPELGLLIGLVLLGGVIYLKYGQHYEMDSAGVKIIWRYPPNQRLIRWSEIDTITARVGLTQTFLGVGNVAIQPRGGGEEMVWYGVESPKLIKTLVERARDESAAE